MVGSQRNTHLNRSQMQDAAQFPLRAGDDKTHSYKYTASYQCTACVPVATCRHRTAHHGSLPRTNRASSAGMPAELPLRAGGKHARTSTLPRTSVPRVYFSTHCWHDRCRGLLLPQRAGQGRESSAGWCSMHQAQVSLVTYTDNMYRTVAAGGRDGRQPAKHALNRSKCRLLNCHCGREMAHSFVQVHRLVPVYGMGALWPHAVTGLLVPGHCLALTVARVQVCLLSCRQGRRHHARINTTPRTSGQDCTFSRSIQ